ncbi:MAG: calcium/sodium antiporter [Salaquimonas sp.]
MLEFTLLAVGLLLLVFGGDFLVKGAVGLAEKLEISPLIIGLTIVAFGTSAPELFISVQAALGGAPGIAIGNVVGSNIANVLLVVGIPAFIAASRCDDAGIGRNMLVMLGFTIVFIGMLFDGYLSRLDGAILAGLLGLFIFDQVRSAINAPDEEAVEDYHDEVQNIPSTPLWIAGMLLIGIVMLPFGADLTVVNATKIAKSWNVSDAVIGLTVVAIGTSLPELATSVMATIRGNSSLAIGNVVGSNIFNIGLIMGTATLIQPMEVDPHFFELDVWIMLACAILIAILAHWRFKIGKRVGVAMMLGYSIYIGSAFIS